MEQFLQTTYSIVLPALLSYIAWYLKRSNKIKDANYKGISLILEAEMICLYEKYSYKEEIPLYAYQHFMSLYEVYVLLGGNGVASKMKESVENFKLISIRE